MNRLCIVSCACVVYLAVVMSAASAAPTMGVIIDDGASNHFGNYLTEIVKTEGFRNLGTEPLSGLTLGQLSTYDTVILSEMSLTSAQASMFSDYVNSGGNLIGMRPDSQLNSVFGISATFGTAPESAANYYIPRLLRTPRSVRDWRRVQR